MLPLRDLVRSACDTSYRGYADDTQPYFLFKTNNLINLTTLNGCLAFFTNWMSQNWLHLNPHKTKVLVIGLDCFSKEVIYYIGPLANNINNQSIIIMSTKNLWIPFDLTLQNLFIAASFSWETKSPINSQPTANHMEHLLHTLTFSRIDYFNSLHRQYFVTCLPSVQNAAYNVCHPIKL